MKNKKCPACSGVMSVDCTPGVITFRGMEIEYPKEVFRCQSCNIEIGTQEQAEKVQNAISSTFRQKSGLLTSDEIRTARDRLGLSQQQLADKVGVGVASIKRWETGAIQTKSMDKTLRAFFNETGQILNCDFSGGRSISLPRIKLVFKEIGNARGKQTKINDSMLYSAKPIWFADMAAYRAYGRGITGASYAALPQGPQLNNYKELIPLIKKSKTEEAEPLSPAEMDIIKMIALKFPTDESAYHAAHREPVWKELEGRIGQLIPYAVSKRLTEI